MATLAEIHQLILDALPTSGGIELSALVDSLPAAERRTAVGQVQALKLSGKLATWRGKNSAGDAITLVGTKANKPTTPNKL